MYLSGQGKTDLYNLLRFETSTDPFTLRFLQPFKRRRIATATSHPPGVSAVRLNSFQGTQYTSPHYPNPGYLGSSSHNEIFSQLNAVPEVNFDNLSGTTSLETNENALTVNKAHRNHRNVNLVHQLRTTLNLRACQTLADAWLDTGVNLALAAPFVRDCVHTSADILSSATLSDDQLCEILTTNSQIPLANEPTIGKDQFVASFTGTANTRWETLGLFFTTLSRAASDLDVAAALFNTQQERQQFRRVALGFADDCLQVALSLDCLNDLQLLLQYENFITHSVVDGDQSKSP